MSISETEQLAVIADLKQRMHALETAGKRLVGPRGPAGPAGPYGEGPKGDQGERGNRGSDARDGRDGVDGKTPSKEELDSLVCQLLHDYGVLEDGCLGQILKYEITKAVFEAVQKELSKAAKS